MILYKQFTSAQLPRFTPIPLKYADFLQLETQICICNAYKWSNYVGFLGGHWNNLVRLVDSIASAENISNYIGKNARKHAGSSKHVYLGELLASLT